MGDLGLDVDPAVDRVADDLVGDLGEFGVDAEVPGVELVGGEVLGKGYDPVEADHRSASA